MHQVAQRGSQDRVTAAKHDQDKPDQGLQRVHQAQAGRGATNSPH
jgi:hypothetical protein